MICKTMPEVSGRCMECIEAPGYRTSCPPKQAGEPMRQKRSGSGVSSGGSRQSDQAYDQVKADIIQCRLRPGEEFTEIELSERYQAGRAAMRAALTRLAEIGLVEPVPRRGFIVTPITIGSVKDLFQVRLIVEPKVAALATGKVDPAYLRQINLAPQAARGGKAVLDFLDSNRAFHLAIAEATGNARLIFLMESLADEMARLVALGLFGSGRTETDMAADQVAQDQQHEALIAAFEANDRDAAEDAARTHIEHSRHLAMSQIFDGNFDLKM